MNIKKWEKDQKKKVRNELFTEQSFQFCPEKGRCFSPCFSVERRVRGSPESRWGARAWGQQGVLAAQHMGSCRPERWLSVAGAVGATGPCTLSIC